MNQSTIRKRLESLVKKINHRKTISDSMVLFGKDGVFDSVGTIKLIMSIEEEFDITIEEKEITPGNLATIAAAARFIESKLVGCLIAMTSCSLLWGLSEAIQN